VAVGPCSEPREVAPERPPSVDRLARSLSDIDLPHALLVEAARQAIADRNPASARRIAQRYQKSLLQPVINATGVLLHTNLARAPQVVEHRSSAWNVEFDLEAGTRGSRRGHASALVARLVGAEDALVVNNGAAAVLLVLTVLTAQRPVIISRGELVEIGGGFRIPEVLSLSGARLVEVGTTNRTRLDDYRRAVESTPDVAALLKVHPSNFHISGFTEAVTIPELTGLGPDVIVDLGSGLLDTNTPWLPGGPPPWLAGEPGARQTISAGAAVVTFSGDKLLGGPQAGIIAGTASIIRECAAHPLARTLRPGALVLHALQETLLAYVRRDGSAIPFWRMATESIGNLRQRAEELAGQTGALMVDCQAVIGGGSAPGKTVPSVGVALPGDRRAKLRSWLPPIVARVHDGQTICDLRTVEPVDDGILGIALREVDR
jgi:L-seryl-tRNA(Ser) seleniumtransferase